MIIPLKEEFGNFCKPQKTIPFHLESENSPPSNGL